MKALQDMSKMELEAYALEKFGVDLNRASSKENLIKEIQAMEHGDKQAPVEGDTLVRTDDAPDKSTDEVVVHKGFSGEEVPPEVPTEEPVQEEVPEEESLEPKPANFKKSAKAAKAPKLSPRDQVLKDMQVEANNASMKEPHHPDCHSYRTNPQCEQCDSSLPGVDDILLEK